MASASSLLSVSNLRIDLFTATAAVRPVDGVSYSVEPGETLAIVGESGSGKTVMNFAPLGLMPPGVQVDIEGSVRFAGKELIGIGAGLRKIRGKQIGFIFQDPMSALNPARRIGRQIAEVAEMHLGMSRAAAEARTVEMMKLVGISDPESRFSQYPHELSGGIRQRVMIAIAIAAEPKMLIADEPTTALDVTVQAQILRLLIDLQNRLGMAMVLVTHDMGVVASTATRVAVMYAGRLVEYGPVDEILLAPRHPYTMSLINAIPRPSDPVGKEFRGLAGVPPALTTPIRGCAFAPRCTHALASCATQRPPLVPIPGRLGWAACPVLN